MKNFWTYVSIMIFGTFSLPGVASAVVIDFDGLAGNVAVTNQFAEATFSSPTSGQEVRTVAFGGDNSIPNIICTATVGGSLNCTDDILVQFTNPAFNLTFLSIGDDTNGVAGLVDVFVSDVFSSTENINGDGSTATGEIVDLSAFSNVTSILIHGVTESGGIGFDDFSFNVTGAVPEPGMLALFGLGLSGLGLMRQKRAGKR